MIHSRNDLLKAVERLPTKIDFLPRSYKVVWIDWLSDYRNANHANQNRNAEVIYNALNHPAMIVWLAAASGTNPDIIRKAVGAIDRQQSRMTQAAAVRRILPWSLIVKQLESAERYKRGDEQPIIPYDHLMPDLQAIYESSEKKTTKRALIAARLGQGQFRNKVGKRWGNQCALTGCAIVSVLRASHIKPWSKSSNHDRLNPANGLLFAAHVDALFDCGLISFSNDGHMLVSAQIADNVAQLHLPDRLRRKPTKDERPFLAYHRRYVFAP